MPGFENHQPIVKELLFYLIEQTILTFVPSLKTQKAGVFL